MPRCVILKYSRVPFKCICENIEAVLLLFTSVVLVYYREKGESMTDLDNHLYAIRHSLAHLLAYSLKQLFPGSQNAIGPAIEDGFYQDFEIVGDFGQEDLVVVERKMKQLLKTWQGFERREVTLDEALEIFADNKYKQELAREFAKEGRTITVYSSGEFVDLCKGGHVDNISQINPDSFKLTKTAGAYWRGDENNIMLTRVYGVAFETKEDLDNHLKALEEAKLRDHRVLGEKLKMFFITPDVGAGLPLLMPRGERVKKTLMDYMRFKEESAGYQYVATPVLTQRRLYERSGHADYYLDNMYATEADSEGNQFFIKPMNCPHHHMIFEKMVESYRDLPLRLSEHAGLYRYELSGTLTGLIRMRGPITQNDSHTYVSADQLKSEFRSVLDMFREVYQETGIDDYWFRLSLPDFKRDKFVQESEQWEFAAKVIREVLDATGVTYEEGVGEAAFYGPKLDVQTKNVLGKEDTIATVQIDVLVPERMGLSYVDADGQSKYPFIIHKSIMGAFERFMAFLLEKTAGNLPVWLSPEQIRIITVNQESATVEFAEGLVEQALELGLRVEVDNSNESVGKKIRSAELMKIPYSVVIGQNEIDTGRLVPRVRKDITGGAEDSAMPVEVFLESVAHRAKARN